MSASRPSAAALPSPPHPLEWTSTEWVKGEKMEEALSIKNTLHLAASSPLVVVVVVVAATAAVAVGANVCG
ncbi:hypothetical protein Cni_G04350 [Canna indica]|uniref:Uncharacterized protein n=1 Tax=Canna indica TaxID=4628 RepID=A0AAQ3JSL2_9LILI|nr:hypothetical protein Cni_G04350 [Canna indica]